jgi:processive 1,2-diacylglycerol beta-glucosyltransferase
VISRDARPSGGIVTEPTRILIFSASFGGGHRTAAGALETYLKQRYGKSVEVRTLDFFKEFAPGLNALGKFAYDSSVQLAPDLYGTFFDFTNRLTNQPLHDLVMAGKVEASAYIEAFRPDAVISTYPVAGGVVSEIKATHNIVCATVITDYGAHNQWLHPATDVYFVATDDMHHDLVRRGLREDQVVVAGIPISERFSNCIEKQVAREELGLETDRFTVLLTMAAGGTSDVREVAKQLDREGIQVVAVAGRMKRLKSRLQSLQRRTDHLHVYGFTNQMHRIMCSSDVLIGKAGGLTVSEALAVGLPLIVHNPVPGQEMFNTDFLVNWGAGFLARDEDDVAEKATFLSRHPKRLAQMADAAGQLGRPFAARTVADTVMERVGR